ncbi:hypothetical protein [Aurantiacibacter odishensis]|uniref:hypothetical protein n=1 Tax=Aurantiacibacter odishensis TaxID=1155476 RepID=UPI000E7681D7|nr:hypothetical protein [Aurantiacibacter odishensis]
MDLNKKYAAHQHALIALDETDNAADRQKHRAEAKEIAGQIRSFQMSLGAAAACAWCALSLTAS